MLKALTSGSGRPRAALLAALAVISVVFALWAPAVVQALGLGDIQVRSRLNEPLDARISLRSLRAGEADSLALALADAESFARAGIQRPFALTQLQFSVVSGAGSSGYVQVRTREPVTEPFLNFLVEATSQQGRVLREYTILLDPPVYSERLAAQAAAQAEAASPARGSVRADGSTAGQPFTGDSYRVRRGDTLYAIARRVRPSRSISVDRMMLALQRANPRAFIKGNINLLRSGAVLTVPSEGEISPIRRAEAIAEVKRQTQAWRAGSSDAGSKPAAQAPTAPAQATASTQGEGATQDTVRIEGATEDASSTSDGGQPAAPRGNEELTREQQALRQQLNFALEQADTARRENAELSERLDEAMALIADLRRMVELKDDDIAALQRQTGDTAVVASVPGTTGDVEAGTETSSQTGTTGEGTVGEGTVGEGTVGEVASSTDPGAGSEATGSTETAEPAAPVTPAPPESMLDQVLNTVSAYTGPAVDAGREGISSLARQFGVSDTVAGGSLAGAGALLLLGFVALRQRRRAARRLPVEDATRTVSGTSTNLGTVTDFSEARAAATGVGIATGAAGAATQPSAGGRTFASDAGLSSSTSHGAGATVEAFAGDPMERVNVYLAYEQYSRAEEAVREAIARDPSNVDYRLRLLEVLRLARNPAAFEASAGQLANLVGEDAPAMAQVQAWWAEISPGRQLDFTVAAEAAAEARHDTVELEGSEAGGGTELEVDFDLGFQLETDPAVTAATQGGGTLDLDLSAAGAATAGEASELDLDLNLGSAPGEADAQSRAAVATSFDAGVAAGSASQAGTDDNALDFDLSGLGGAAAGAAAGLAAGAAAGLAGDSADPGSLIARATERADTSTDGGLDFDLEAFGGQVAAGSEDVPTVDEALAGVWQGTDEEDTGAVSHLDFNLDVGGETASGIGQQEAPEETADTGPQPDGTLASLSLDSLDAGSVIPSPEESAATGLDFDLGGMEDLTGSSAVASESGTMAPAASESVGGESSDTTGLEFDLEGTEIEPAPELNLDLNDLADGSSDVMTQAARSATGSGLSALDLSTQEATGASADARAESSASGSESSGSDSSGSVELSFGEGDVDATPGIAGGVDFDLSFTDEVEAAAASGTGTGSGSHVDIDLSFPGDPDGEPELAAEGTGSVPTAPIQVDEQGPEAGGQRTATEIEDFEAQAQTDGDDGPPVVRTVRLGPGQMSTVRLASNQLAEDEPVIDPSVSTQSGSSGSDSAGSGEGADTEFLDIFAPPESDAGADAGTSSESSELDLANSLGGVAGFGDGMDDVQTKLDLAQTYIDMEDADSARGVLTEVIDEGSPDQKEIARRMMGSMDD